MPDRPDETLRRFGRNSVALLVSDVAGRLLTAAFRVALAGYLGRELFGAWSFAMAVAMVIGVLADLGLATLVTREVARRPGSPFDVAGPAMSARLLLLLPTGGLALLLLFVTGDSPAVLSLTAILLGTQAILAPGEILAAAHRGRERMVRPAAATVVTRAGFVLSGFVAMALGAGVHVFAALAVAWAIPLVLLLRPGLPGRLRPIVRGCLPVLRRALPIGLGTVLWTIYFRLDLVLLGILRGEGEVGLYSAPFSIVEAVLLLQGPLLAAAFPVLSRETGGRRTYRLTVRLLAAGGLVAAGVLVVGRGAILSRLFGPAYAGAETVLLLLALTIPVSALAAPRLMRLVARDGERVYARIMGAGLAANLVLDLALIPTWGAAGAAVATLATECLVTALTFIVPRRS
ncbi:MAG: oligosaccharide flippase family protein [Planctomycetota bacterium]